MLQNIVALQEMVIPSQYTKLNKNTNNLQGRKTNNSEIKLIQSQVTVPLAKYNIVVFWFAF